MRFIKNIDIEESIFRNKLVFQEEWRDKLNRFIIFSFTSTISFYSIMGFFEFNPANPNDQIVYIVSPITIIFCLYVMFRTLREKHLICITTSLEKKENRELILDFANDKDFRVYRKSGNFIILNDTVGEVHQIKTIVLIVQDNEILFTILREGYKLNYPVLTSHLFLKHDLKKFIMKWEKVV